MLRNLMQRNGRAGAVQVPIRFEDFHLGVDNLKKKGLLNL